MTALAACPYEVALRALVTWIEHSLYAPIYAEPLGAAKQVLAAKSDYHFVAPTVKESLIVGSIVQDGEYGVAVRDMAERFDANEVPE